MTEFMQHPTLIGLFGIGLDPYWPQFKGLKPRLQGCLRKVHGPIERQDKIRTRLL